MPPLLSLRLQWLAPLPRPLLLLPRPLLPLLLPLLLLLL
jgi:hypothetical protein